MRLPWARSDRSEVERRQAEQLLDSVRRQMHGLTAELERSVGRLEQVVTQLERRVENGA